MLTKLWKEWRQHDAAYGPLINSYDLIKALAVIIMIIDHTGFYFFPEQEYWRAIGRTGFPVWFFLAGYSRKGSIQWSLLPGMLILVGEKAALNVSLLPINALLTIFLIRLMIIQAPLKITLSLALAVSVLAALFFPFTTELFEYGTIGLLFGYLGYLCKNTPDGPVRRFMAVLAFSAFIYTMQFTLFHFSLPAALLMSSGTAAFCIWLYFFRSFTLPEAASLYRFGKPIPQLIRTLGRHTLLIYVIHLFIFQALKAYVTD